MNILIVHETEYVKKVVHEYQIIPELLASRGHKVFVIDYPNRFEKNSFFDFGSLRTQYLKNIKKANKNKGITLIRPGIIKIPVLSRVIAFIEYFFIVPNIIKKYKIKKIYQLSAPTNGLQTVFWAKIYKIPILFRLLDVLHQLVPSKILIWPTYLIERLIYPQVNEIIAVTPSLRDYAIEMGGNKKTTFYLPTGADTDLFYPQVKNKTLAKQYHLLKSDIVILFSGTLYNFSGLDKLLEYFAKHIKELPKIKFLIVGEGEQYNRLKKIIGKNEMKNRVVLTGFVQYEKLSEIINVADVCINPFEINKITDSIIPGKIYQYLACGKPVIATRLKGIREILPDLKGKNNIYYFDINKPKEFYNLLGKIKKTKNKSTQPSLQKIASIVEDKLKKLKV